MKSYTISQLMADMITYFAGDYKRISHAQKVQAYTRTIAELEGLPAPVVKKLEAAAILHDIGIPEAIRIHGSGAPAFQEREGARVAGEILADYDLPAGETDWILAAVGSHHTYEKADPLGFRILFEADYLVNIMEKNVDASPENVRAIRASYFRTPAALRLFDALYADGNGPSGDAK